MAEDDGYWEYTHNFIQWLFPYYLVENTDVELYEL